MYAQVIVDVPTMQTNQPYTYAVPEALTEVLAVGMRVVVPFGRGNRLIQGFVVGFVTAVNEATELKAIESVVELEPVLNEELLDLGQWLAETNFAFHISVLQTMLPNVMRAKYSKTFQLVEPNGLVNEPDVQVLFADRSEIPFNETEIAPELLPKLQRLQRAGVLQVGYVVDNRATAKTVLAMKPLLSASEYDDLRQNLRKTAVKQARFLTYLMTAPQEFVPIKTVLDSQGLDYPTIKKAAEQGWIERAEIEEYRLPRLSSPIEPTSPLTLNPEQETAYTAIAASLGEAQTKTFLLEGITGSGKTEVYLQAIARTLQQGKTAIMLVPEITLTPQMVRRVKGRFGDDVAVMHSGLSEGERYDEWRRVERHEVNVVVGARSAIFAPLENIGLIVIDEEHEATYKQDENPRYHARDVAQWRAERHGATLVLGSATPSLESRARAQRGVYTLLTLTERALHNPLPKAEVVDMREAMKAGGDDIFSPQMLDQLRDRLDKNEQSVLMLNRRGYANFMMCRNCGYVPRCVNCDLAMTVHKDTGRLECHYCGYSEPIPTTCANCGSDRIRPYGTGTQKVEEELQRMMPDARIIRMDVDTTRRKGATDKMLADFGDKKADILLGTQMIAKGLDFPDVTLVGVLNADTTLGLPDYRASERTFQLLTQVAGRAGRADKEGEVVIQTFNPDHYAIQLAKTQDYEAFYRQEMNLRHTWQYAPYYYTVQIKIAHERQDEAAKVAYQTANWLKKHLASDSVLLGPSTGAITRLKNKYYYRMVIKFKHDDGLEAALTELVSAGQRLQKQGVVLTIDRDPVNFI
ncbi:primosomal protein N' [Weissella cibaria]|uniref:primosomal protein N' n=1 Tax=Weissella cibaria TaxID=137591 RepID=UPI0015F626CD|nr:primosomal protein N' [Weissella cibaria]QMU89388.1 primosomal protein N' [Weissella cibaria]